MMNLGGNIVSGQVFYILYPSVLGDGFRWCLVGKCSGSVSGWCSSNGSRLGSDRELFVMQISGSLNTKLLSFGWLVIQTFYKLQTRVWCLVRLAQGRSQTVSVSM